MERSARLGLALITAILPARLMAEVDGSSLYGMLSYPVSDNGGIKPGPNAGQPGQGKAKLGWGAGFDYTYPLPSSSWGLLGSLQFAMNPMDDADTKELNPAGTVDMGSWINIPLLVGIKYQATGDPVTFYAAAQGGANMAWPSYSKLDDERLETETTFSAAAAGALGLIFTEKVDLALRFLMLPGITHKGQLVNADLSREGKQTLALVGLTLGIHIK